MELRERVEAYIVNVELAIDRLAGVNLPSNASRLVELAKLYVDDAKYYLSRGDAETALADIAYAEGLIDALRWLGYADFEWEPLSKLLERPRVVVAGTFDLLHPGHVALLREAWRHGRVYAIVARDENVKRFKGREPIIPEEQRLEMIGAIRYVHQAVLGSPRDVLEPLEKIKPHIVLLGPDQWAQEEWLRERLEERGINAKIARLESKYYCRLCSTTEIACRVLRVFPSHLCGEREAQD